MDSRQGAKISFCYDNWVFQYPLSEVCSVMRGSETLTVDYFINQEKQWDTTRLRLFLHVSLVDDILAIFIPRNNIEDKLVWALSPDGCYYVKSGVSLLQGNGLEAPSSDPFLWIWRLKVPPKIKSSCGRYVIMGFLQKKKIRNESYFLSFRVCFL